MTGLQQISAAQSGAFTVLLPVCAALVGVFGLGEEFGSIQRLAFGLAVVSVLLATVPVHGRDRVAPDAR
jgi:drug/metabolite transporter (DMT)-like permease